MFLLEWVIVAFESSPVCMSDIILIKLLKQVCLKQRGGVGEID